MQINLVAAVTAGMLACASNAHADDDACSRIGRSNVVRCAEAASLEVRAQMQEVDVASARRVGASTLLPSNPALTFSGARRTAVGGPASATNWYGSIAQEIEIAGQRGLRREAAAHDVLAQQRRTVATERDVAAEALVAYFDVVAARELVQLATRLEATGKGVAVATRARAESGVGSPLESDIADSASIALVRARLAAERAAESARIELSVLVGRDPASGTIEVDGELDPLPDVPLAPSRIEEQPSIQALEEEGRFFDVQASVLRRTRIPNPTFQLYVQNDGFDERVYGAGVSFPLPLPAPLGRTNRGEIAEAEARSARSTTRTELEKRTIQQRFANATQTFASRRHEVEAFTTERIARAERVLADIAGEIRAGRLAVRDALFGQQALIEILRGSIDSRHALCVASVELARAAGVPLERGAR